MKSGIHPEWHPEAKVECLACGTTFTVGATVPEIQTEICSTCHPFFTGEQRIVDTAGQVERFMRRLQAGVSHREQEEARKQQEADEAREERIKRRGLTPIAEKAAASDDAEPDADADADADAEASADADADAGETEAESED